MPIVSCSVKNCDRKSAARGWCNMHYKRWKRHGDPEIIKPGNGQLGDMLPVASEGERCAVESCLAQVNCRGWCRMHYKRWLRNGDPLSTRVRDDARPCESDGCEDTIRVGGYCYGHYVRFRRHGNAEAGRKRAVSATDHPDDTRSCNTCGERKLMTEYHLSKSSVRGRSSKCRDCTAVARREWVEANQALVDERARSYRHKRRALIAESGFEKGLTREKIRISHGDLCAYCGIEMRFDVRGRSFVPNKATIDHIVPIALGGGHVSENVTLCCSRCNASKGDKPLSEWVTQPLAQIRS